MADLNLIRRTALRNRIIGACFQLYAIQKATQKQFLIDICINNAIIGVQEQNTYAQTEG